MYRVIAPPADAEVPRELEYPLENMDRIDKSSLGLFQIFAFPLFVAALLAVVGLPNFAIFGMAVTAVVILLWWRRKGDVLVFRVDDGLLTVARRGSKKLIACLRLDELANVILDTKEIRQHQESASPIPGMRFADSRVGPPTDRARIVLVAREGEEEPEAWIPLSDAYGRHFEASEQFAKIRVFLRKHGWLPEDEREPPPSE